MNQEKENPMELTNTENNKIESNENSELKELKVTLGERIRKTVGLLTVEPFLIMYVIPLAIAAVAVTQLNMEKACRVDLSYNETFCFNLVRGISNDNTTKMVREMVSKAVSNMQAWQHPMQSGIPAIFVLFVGAWSDRTGNRKVLMLMPVLGEIVSVSGLLLATYYFLEWPLWTTGLIESLPTACSGGTSMAIMGAYSYIADVTTVESRTLRVGVMAVIVTLSFPLGISISGILVQGVGYYGVFGIQLALYILGFTYTYFRVHNIKNEPTEGTFLTKLKSFFHPYNVWDTISLVIVTPYKQRIRIILVLCVLVLIFGPAVGENSVMQLYVYNRYTMTPAEFSLFSTYNILMGTIGTSVAIGLFSKYLKMHDTLIGIIATACKTVSSIVYGLAPNKQWLYSGPAFDFFGNSGTTIIRSLGTKVVDADKIGKMSSLIGLVDSLVPVAYSPLYNKVFNATLSSFPGAVYFLGSIMTVPAFFVFITLYYMYRKDERDAVKDPAAKETHAHDNEVTTV